MTSEPNDIEVRCSDGENSTQTDTVMFVIIEAIEVPADEQLYPSMSLKDQL